MHKHVWRRLRRRRPDSGFTLIELMVALLILAIVMSASLYGILQGLRLSRDTQERVVASNVVTGVLERVESTALNPVGFSSLAPNTIALPSQTIQGTTFTLTQTTEWVNRGVTSSVCDSGTNSSLLLRATVTATWGYKNESVTDSTLLAPPNGTLSSSDGSLPVQVDQADGTGFAGATVTATPTIGKPAANGTFTHHHWQRRLRLLRSAGPGHLQSDGDQPRWGRQLRALDLVLGCKPHDYSIERHRRSGAERPGPGTGRL